MNATDRVTSLEQRETLLRLRVAAWARKQLRERREQQLTERNRQRKELNLEPVNLEPVKGD